MNKYTKGQPVTLINGMRAGYIYLGSTPKRDVILNIVTGEVKQVYHGKLVDTAHVLKQVLKIAA